MNNLNFMVKEICKTTVLGIGSIKRYNTIHRIHEENVAEHSLYVAYNVMRLCDILEVDDVTRLNALQMAIIHDIPECLLGDVPYSTKQRSPEISKVLSKMELEDIQSYMPEIYDKYKAFQEAEESESIEGQLVKLADAISVVQYCEIEKSLGNVTENMMEILYSSYIRVENRLNTLIETLEKEGKK